MSDATPRDWRLYLEDMIRFCEKIQTYTVGLDRTAFGARGIAYDATLRNLELIGEAATNIPEAVRLAHPQIPWRMIVATRNRLIHGYLGIDDDTIWSIVETNIPTLLQELQTIEQSLPALSRELLARSAS